MQLKGAKSNRKLRPRLTSTSRLLRFRFLSDHLPLLPAAVSPSQLISFSSPLADIIAKIGNPSPDRPATRRLGQPVCACALLSRRASALRCRPMFTGLWNRVAHVLMNLCWALKQGERECYLSHRKMDNGGRPTEPRRRASSPPQCAEGGNRISSDLICSEIASERSINGG